MEHREAVVAIKKKAKQLRRLHKKTGNGLFKAQAEALSQLAVRVTNAVPVDPDQDTVGTLLAHWEGERQRVKRQPRKVFKDRRTLEDPIGSLLVYSELLDD
jgi:hypothetical protein